MKVLMSTLLIVSFAIHVNCHAQDTRITPGVSNPLNGLKSPGKELDGSKDNVSDKESCQDEQSCDNQQKSMVDDAMELLPKMVFRVGDQETCCHMTATRLAHEAHEKVVYYVGKKRYHDSRDAFESLVKQTEIYVKRFMKPSVCSESGTTTLAGTQCNCSESAAKLNDSLANTVRVIKMKFRVGEKEFEKFHDARRYAKKTHNKGAYVVAGEVYEDEYEARLALARKQYQTAVETVADFNAKNISETSDTASESNSG